MSTKDFVTAFAKQVVTSAFMLVAGTAYSIAHPISTLQALPGSISGVGSSLQNGYSSFRNGSDSDRGSVLGSLTVAVASLAMPESRAGAISDDALVVRGGGLANQSVGKINDAIRLSREKGVNGFSVQCNATCTSIEQLGVLGQDLKNSQVGVTTAGAIREAGGAVMNTGTGSHATVFGLTGEQASPLFQNIFKNPNPKP